MRTESDQLTPAPNAAHLNHQIDDDAALPEAEVSRAAKKVRTMTTEADHSSSGEEDFVDVDTSFLEFDGDPEKGTTALAFICEEGVMVATDHPDASEAFLENIIDLNCHVIVTVSGEIPDPGSFLRNLQMLYHEHEAAAKGEKSVYKTSKWVANHMASCKEVSSVKMIIVGLDAKKGPSLYYVDGKECILGKGKVAGIGSGIEMVYFHFRDGLYRVGCDEAVEYARKAINCVASGLAYFKKLGDDCETGGFLTGYYVGAAGWKRVFHNEPFVCLPQDEVELVTLSPLQEGLKDPLWSCI